MPATSAGSLPELQRWGQEVKMENKMNPGRATGKRGSLGKAK